MKKLTLFVLLLSAALLIAACGGDDEASDADTNGDNPVEESADDTTADSPEDAAFVVNISGAEEGTINGAGRVVCFADIGDGQLEVSPSSGFSNNVLISLPQDIEPGTYEFEDPTMAIPGQTITVTFIGEDMMEDGYEGNPEGTLELTSVPTTGGEQLTGSFEVTLTNNDTDEVVTLNGEFDFTAEDFGFTECDAA